MRNEKDKALTRRVQLGRKLKTRREDLGLAQAAVAKKVGTHTHTISDVERAVLNYGVDTLLAMQAVYDKEERKGNRRS